MPDTTFTETQARFGSPGMMNSAQDKAQDVVTQAEQAVKQTTGVSLFHLLTLGSIVTSIALFLSGRKAAGIFVGLWPPTLQALKSVIDEGEHHRY